MFDTIRFPMGFKACTAFILWLSASFSAFAHEYWVEPKTYVLKSGETLEANLKNGQNFRGSSFSYITNQFEEFEISVNGKALAVDGRQGDIPALNKTMDRAGLNIITYWSTKSDLIFREWQKFTDYLAYEGLSSFKEKHLVRGLPQEGFKEIYSRNAKALVQVGPVEDADVDQSTGMPIELIALENPYAATTGRTLNVRLEWQGTPVQMHQIRIFEKPSNLEVVQDAKTTTVETDANGIAAIPIKAGHDYLLNAVRMEARDGSIEKLEPVWETWWASLTFQSPE